MRNPLHAFAAFLFRRRLRGALRFHNLALGRAPLDVASKHGVELRLDPYEYVANRVLLHGYYEEEVLNAIREDLRPGDVFWDVGSCLGIHALTVAKLHPAVRVHAFEPNPAMAALIRRAAGKNGLAVRLEETALGATDGSCEFYVEPGNAGRSGTGVWNHTSAARKISVALATADGLVARGDLPAPHVVKLDVEGSEHDVLLGMHELLRGRDLRRVIFEDGREESRIKVLLRAAGLSTIRPLVRLDTSDHGLENHVAVR